MKWPGRATGFHRKVWDHHQNTLMRERDNIYIYNIYIYICKWGKPEWFEQQNRMVISYNYNTCQTASGNSEWFEPMVVPTKLFKRVGDSGI